MVMKHMLTYELITLTHNRKTPYNYHRRMYIYTTLNKDCICQHTVVDAYVHIQISQHFCKVTWMSR